MPNVLFENLMSYKQGCTKPYIGVLEPVGNPGASKTVFCTQRDLDESDELKSLLAGVSPKMRITVQEKDGEQRLDSPARGIESQMYLDCKVTGTVVTAQGNSGAPTPAATVLAPSFTGVQPDQPRTLKLVCTGLGSVVGRKATVNGRVRGKLTSEDFAIPTAAPTVEGLKPFDVNSIVSVVFPLVPTGGSVSVQLSDKLGLDRGINAAGDVTGVTKNGAAVVTGTVDAVNSTVAQTIGAGDDFTIHYNKQ
jgi:hypothetical protein